jgi:DNA mismatch endonuclease, patch repair protein
MSGIRGLHTKPELVVRSYLHRRGLRYSLHRGDLPGKPDIVFARFRAVIFVHGCFWHRHLGCSLAYTPKSNVKFWSEKLNNNVVRDRRQVRALRQSGWRVFIVWECQLTEDRLSKLFQRLTGARCR